MDGVTLQQLSLRYDVNRSTIPSWLRKVRSGGSLYDVKRRGRPPKTPMARPKKRDPQTELEKLQAENLRLRAENALLKNKGLSRGTEIPSTAQWAKAIDGLRSKYPLSLLLKLIFCK